MLVQALSTAQEIERYVDFGRQVYAQDPCWVPPDAHHLTGLLSGTSALASDARVQPFCVRDADQIVATVTGVVDEAYNRHWNERMGHLLFFEALPGRDDAVMALFQAASEWLGAQGCEAMRSAFLYGWQLPHTIDAYASIPTIFHTYNHPYYHRYIKDAGFRTEQGMIEYRVDFSPELAQRYREMVSGALRAGVRLRPMNFERLEENIAVFTRLLNETFAAHWGSPQFTRSQMEEFILGLKDLLVADMTGFAELDGQTAGFVFSLPDLNQPLHRLRDKALEENLAEFQRLWQQIDHGVLLIIGVQESCRGRGLNLALAAKSYLAMIERGYKSASYTVVLDDNWASRRTAEKLGCRVARNFSIYRKDLRG